MLTGSTPIHRGGSQRPKLSVQPSPFHVQPQQQQQQQQQQPTASRGRVPFSFECTQGLRTRCEQRVDYFPSPHLAAIAGVDSVGAEQWSWVLDGDQLQVFQLNSPSGSHVRLQGAASISPLITLVQDRDGTIGLLAATLGTESSLVYYQDLRHAASGATHKMAVPSGGTALKRLSTHVAPWVCTYLTSGGAVVFVDVHQGEIRMETHQFEAPGREFGMLGRVRRAVAPMFGAHSQEAQLPNYISCCTMEVDHTRGWCYLLRQQGSVYAVELWQFSDQAYPVKHHDNVLAEIQSAGAQLGSADCAITGVAVEGTPGADRGLWLLDQHNGGLRVLELHVPVITGVPDYITHKAKFPEVSASRMQELSSSDVRPVGFFALGSASQQNAYVILPHLAVQLQRDADPLFLTPSLLGLQCQLEHGVYRGDTVLSAALLADSVASLRLATPSCLLNMSHEQTHWDSGDQNMTAKLRAAFGHFWKEQAVELDRVLRYSLSVPGKARNDAILECSRDDILQASDFGLLSFQRNGPRQPSLVLEMLQEKLQRHSRYIEMLALEGKLPQGQRSLIDELGAAGRAELLQHHAMIYAAVELLQLQAGEAGQSRVMVELVSKAVELMRESVRGQTGGSEKDKIRRDEANSQNFDGTFWLYSYTHSLDQLLCALAAAKQQMPQADVYEVSAAVAMLFEVLLGTVVSVYEQRQKEGFLIGAELEFPRLPYELRHVLFQTILETGRRVQDRMKGSWAPQLRGSLLQLVRIYLQAHRAHGLMPECYLAEGPYEDNDYAKPRELSGGGKAVLFSRSKVLYTLMVCDPVNAQQLAEEFEDCTTLAYVALRNEDPAAGRAMLVEYVSRFEKVFIGELLALLFAHGRLGDMLQFVLSDLRQEYRGIALESLQEFINDELKCNKTQEAHTKLQQLQWLLQLQSGAGTAPDSTSCEYAARALHTLCDQGGSYDQRTHAALACLTAAATDVPRAEGSRSDAVNAALSRCRLRAMEVALHPDQFAVRSCGVGLYPHPVDAPARSWEDLMRSCLLEVGFESLKNRFHSTLQGRFPEEIAIERLQDFSINRRVWALEVCELQMNAHQILSQLRALCPSVWHRAKAAVAGLTLDEVEEHLAQRGITVEVTATDEDKRLDLEAVFRGEDQHHDTPLVDAMRSVMEGDHQHADNVAEIMQCRAALKHRMLVWNGNPQKYGRKAELDDFPQVPGALDDPASLPELDWGSDNAGIMEGYINSSFYRTASEWLESVKARSGQEAREAELKLMATQFQHAKMPQLVNDLTGRGFFQRCRRPHPPEVFFEDIAEDDV